MNRPKMMFLAIERINRRFVSPTLFLAAFFVALLVSPAGAVKKSESNQARYIVVFKDSVEAPGQLARTHTKRRDAKLGFIYRHVLKGYSAVLTEKEVEGLERDSRVAYIEHDARSSAASQTTSTGIKRVFAASNEALAINEEEDVVIDADVAVFDTGIDEHPDLNVVSQINCSSGEPPACVEGGGDGHGHGTYVAGILGAIDNDFGVVGVASGVRLWAVKVLNNEAKGTLTGYIAGLEWATEHADEIEVANSSLGFQGGSSKAFEEAMEASLDAGIVHVVAAGNEGSGVNTPPGMYPGVITVSAVADFDGQPGGLAGGGDDSLWENSNRGPLVDIAAPGFAIKSIWQSGYESFSGTSAASPHVAGAAAILASTDDPTSQEDVEAIRETLLEEGTFDWTDTGDGKHEPLLNVSNETVFTTVQQLKASTLFQTGMSPFGATLNGKVNPRGLATTYQFEYGKTKSYGSKVPVSPESIGSGTSDVKVDDVIEGLEPSTTYHYRVVATNEEGTAYGQDREFMTFPASKPFVTTEAVSNLTPTGATLNAKVNPKGHATTYQFEYGKTKSYGSKVPVSPESIGSGTSDVKVDEAIEDLSFNTTYHYRVVATSKAGTTQGEDLTFTTPLPAEVFDWTYYGVPIEEPTAFELEGDLEFTYKVGVDVDCAFTAEGTLLPEGEGEITKFTPNCVIANSQCSQASATSTVPWSIHATAQQTMLIDDMSFEVSLTSPCKGILHITSDMTATPNDPTEITTLQLVGKNEDPAALWPNHWIFGDASVMPSGAIGIE